MKKIISLLLIILLLFSIFYSTSVYADEDIGKIKKAMKDKDGGVSDASGLTGSKTASLLNIVIGIIQVVGTGISLIVISILGIKYLIASPSDKADVKKNIMPILIGCILLFAASNIIGIVENFSTQTLGMGE